MHGPTCMFRAELTAFSLQNRKLEVKKKGEANGGAAKTKKAKKAKAKKKGSGSKADLRRILQPAAGGVRKTPSCPSGGAGPTPAFHSCVPVSRRNARAGSRLSGRSDTFLALGRAPPSGTTRKRAPAPATASSALTSSTASRCTRWPHGRNFRKNTGVSNGDNLPCRLSPGPWLVSRMPP